MIILNIFIFLAKKCHAKVYGKPTENDESRVSDFLPIYSWRKYLQEETISKAIEFNHFKINRVEYFYLANKHWRSFE